MFGHDTANKTNKYLSPLDTWSMAFGCMVGWGAFVMPGTTFLPVAGPAGTVIAMVVSTVIILIIGSNILEIPAEKAVAAMKIRKDTFSYGLFQMTRTFILSAIGRIFFFAANAVEARAIFFRMFNFRNPALYTLWDGSMYTYGLDQYAYYLAWLLIAMLWGIGMVQERGVVIRDWIGKQNLLFRWVLYLLLIASLLILGVYGKGYDASKFVYGAF